MRALVCRRTGEAPDLAVVDAPRRALRPGELRIAVAASGVNVADAMQAAGAHQNTPATPFIPGFEAAGVVIESAVDGPLARDARVVAAVSCGAHAAELAVDARAVAAAPEGVALQAAATLPVAHATALTAFREGAALRPGERVLVTGAAGKVGSAAVDVAGWLGAEVFAVVQRADQALALEGRACAVVADAAELETAVREATGGRGVEVVFDTVNGPVLGPAMKVLAPLGRYLVIGLGAGRAASLVSTELLVRNLALIGVDWDWRLRHDLETAHSVLTTLSGWWSRGFRAAPAAHPRPLADGPTVLAELRAGALPSRTVLIP